MAAFNQTIPAPLAEEDDGWQTQDKKKVNKKKSQPTATNVPLVNDKKTDKKYPDYKSDGKLSMNKLGGDSNQSSWRKGSNSSSQAKPAGVKDHNTMDQQLQKKVEKPAVEDTVTLMLEKLQIARNISLPLAEVAPLSLQPYASILVGSFYGAENSNEFNITHEKAESDIVNVLVRSKLDFPCGVLSPQIEHFNVDQLRKFAQFVLEDSNVAEVSRASGILTWAEGGFKHDSSSKFYAHLRMPIAELSSIQPSERTSFVEALHHTYAFASCDVKCDFQPTVELKNEEKTLLNSMVLKLMKRLGSSEDSFVLFREFDCMQITVWDNLKKNPVKAVCNCLWNPLTFSSHASSWFKLPVAERSSQYFQLFGFDDREYDLHSAATNMTDKSALSQAKFLRFDSKRHCLQLTRNAQHATTFFQAEEGGEVQIVWKDNNSQAETLHSIHTFLSPKKHQPGNPINVYFDDDFKKLKLSLNKMRGAPWESAHLSLDSMRSHLSFHPFLPIVGVKKPSNSTDKLTFCLESLQRFVSLIQHSERKLVVVEDVGEEVTGCDFGCEVVLFLHSLRQDDTTEDVRRNNVTGIPGFSLFSESEQSEWSDVVGYCWMLPLHYYHNTLLPEAAEWRENWFKRCEELGKQFKVMS